MNSHHDIDSNNNARGRPRSQEVHTNILNTTLALLAEFGFEKISIEMIAQRAGVGKSSIYRRWSSKEELVVDALERLKPAIPPSTQGEIHEVMFELARGFAHNMNNPLGRQMLSLLISTLAGSSQVSESYWTKHSLPKTKEITTLFDQYLEQSSLRTNANLEVASELLIGYVMFQLLLKPASTDLDTELQASIDIILNGVRNK